MAEWNSSFEKFFSDSKKAHYENNLLFFAVND